MMSQSKSNCLRANLSWIIQSSGHHTRYMVTRGQTQAGRESTAFLLLPNNKQRAHCHHRENKPKETGSKGEQPDAPMSEGEQPAAPRVRGGAARRPPCQGEQPAAPHVRGGAASCPPCQRGSSQTPPMSKVDRRRRRISFELRMFTGHDYRET